MSKSGNKGQGSNWIAKDKRLAITIRDGFSCAYCGRDLRGASPGEVTLDHLVPRSVFRASGDCTGMNEATNLITACRACNSSRGEKPWIDYAAGGAVDRIQQLRYAPLNRPLAKALIAGTAGDAEIEAMR